ncbi:adenylyl-sulfate kinase [Candidatus Pelagibacter sp. RS39]|uniref:adenylyl-sulfate kinase n=1 Tax=Candidatus Pelagibacter sp. RS39 TaxID=1977864 RepID=UPI000A158385|nr:adenylyl-sulfate kinase [Candidatus Pelagibacter sp. RS39]ARJ47511.1 hypothetical protein B5L73_01590 [Candidatus Pelagibacter sp. RS39]
MKHRLIKNKGILFWITGYSGSGKTKISNKIKSFVEKKFGKTIVLSGDNFRQKFKINSYDKKSRIMLGNQYTNFLKIILDQKINIIFTVVGLYDQIRKYNVKKIDNYIEIFIDAKIKDIKINSKKMHYKKKQKNILGIDLKPELPKKSDITIKNNFKISTDQIARKIIDRLNKYEH